LVAAGGGGLDFGALLSGREEDDREAAGMVFLAAWEEETSFCSVNSVATQSLSENEARAATFVGTHLCCLAFF
jgi:hypothetical protein